MENNYKKWEDLSDWDKMNIDFLEGYRDSMYIRFAGKQSFDIQDSSYLDIVDFYEKLREIHGDNFKEMLNSYSREKNDIKELCKKRGEEIAELFYNILHAEGIKLLDEYKKLQDKYVTRKEEI
jgi:hypothetical protein